MVEQDRNQRYDASYTIFSMMCIELWCRMFIDHPVPSLDQSYHGSATENA
jgi:asparagine synthase (glutamine-hydrolysing)